MFDLGAFHLMHIIVKQETKLRLPALDTLFWLCSLPAGAAIVHSAASADRLTEAAQALHQVGTPCELR